MAGSPAGLDKWTRQVQRIPESVKQAMRESQGKNADKLVTSIKAFVPRKSGDLADSVNWSRGLPPYSEATGAFRLAQKDLTLRQSALNTEGLLVCVYAGDGKAYYARWVEFGTKFSPAGTARSWTRARTARGWRNRSDGRNNARPHHATKAQPYFYPVIRAYSFKIKRSTASAGNRALKKAIMG